MQTLKGLKRLLRTYVASGRAFIRIDFFVRLSTLWLVRNFLFALSLFSLMPGAAMAVAPVISDVDNVLNYTEGDPATVIDSTITITDPDSANMNQAQVILGSGFDSSDLLSYTTIHGITGSFTCCTPPQMTLSGTATKAQYEEALESVKFSHTSNNPSTTTRTLYFVVRDTTNASSASDTTTLTVTPVNDAPVISSVDNVANYTENAAAVTIDSTITITDDDSANLNQATVSLTTNFNSSQDSLVYSTVNGITGSYNSSTGVLTLSGAASKANYEAALETVKYQNSSDDPSTATRTISFVVRDTDNLSSSPDTTTLTITAVNDAPVISGVDNVATFIGGAGAVVIDPTITITDIDSGNMNQATVVISGNNSTADSLVYSTLHGITGSFSNQTTHSILTLSGTATKAQYEEALESVKFNSSGTPSTATRTITFSVRDTANSVSNNPTTTLTVKSPPAISDVNNVANYTENAAAVTVDSTITITDGDSANLNQATVSLTTNFNSSQDSLVYSTVNGITGSYNSSTGVLTLSGTASKANYEAALETVKYQNSSDDPSTATRTISLVARDTDNYSSNPATTTLTVTAVNDAPVISGVDNVATFIGGAGAVVIDPTITIADVDSGNMNQATVVISGNNSVADSLVYSTIHGITGSFVNNGTHSVLTLSGTATKAQYEEALESVKFNSSSTPSTATRTILFSVRDTANSVSNNPTTTLTVKSPPAISDVNNVANYTENAAPVTIDSTITITDGDSANLNQATVSLTTNFNSSQDSLVYSTVNGITGSYNSGTGVLTLSGVATKVQYEQALESVQYQNSSEDPSTATRTISFVVRDTDNYSSSPDTTTLTVTAVNDVPVISDVNNVANFVENGSSVVIDPTITITDPDSAHMNQAVVVVTASDTSADSLVYTAMHGITIGSYHQYGNGIVMYLSGTATKAQYEEALKSVKFSNTSDNPSTATREITFNVRDTSNSYGDPVTTTLTVTAINDAPAISGVNNVANFSESTGTAVVIDSSITITDPDDANMNQATVSITTNFTSGEDSLVYSTVSGITGSYNSSAGVLTLSGTASKANYEAALETVKYQNTSNDPNPATRTISFVVWDANSASSAPDTTILTITPNNELPVISDVSNVANYTENGSAVVIDDAVTITDSDNANLNRAIISITTNFSGAEDVLVYSTVNGIVGFYNGMGVLTLSGVATKSQYEEALESVKYQNTSDNPNTATRTLLYVVRDTTNTNSIGSTTTLTVAATNDAPIIGDVDNVVVYTAGDLATVIDPDITIADPDSSNMSQARVSITNNFASAEDSLVYTDINGISGSYNSGNGELTLSGTATKAQYEQALESVKYLNSSGTPTLNTRTLSFMVWDSDSAVSEAGTTSLILGSTPVISGVDNVANYTENGSAVTIDSSITIIDSDNANLDQAKVSIASPLSEDQLVYTTVNGITGSYSGGVLTLSGVATLAQYEQALESVQYRNTSNNPNTATRNLSFTVRDTTGEVSTPDTTTLTIGAVNDAPVINGVDNIAGFVASLGAPVTIDGSIAIMDSDSAQLNQATVSITGNFSSSEDELVYSTIHGIAGSYGGGTGVLTLSGTATLAQYEQALESVKYYNSSSTPNTATRTISFAVRDTENAGSIAETTTLVIEATVPSTAILPDEFQHDINDASFLPYMGSGDFVAITEGNAQIKDGAALYSVPIVLPPAVNDLKPNLALSYNSRAGNGLVGVGWSLSGLSTISRCQPTYATEGSEAQSSSPRYTNGDRLCLDGQKLEVASSGTPANDSTYWTAGAEYRTEIDGFARIKAYGSHNGAHQYFVVHTRDGRILTYGKEDDGQNSRIYAPGRGSGGPVSVWALDTVADRYDNEYTIHYQRNNSDGDYYPTHMAFEPGASVVFTYEDRDSDISGNLSDMPYGYDKGYFYKHPKLLDKITTYINVSSPASPVSGTKVREYDIIYTRSATTDRYLVDQIEECGFNSGARVCAKALEFEWQVGELGFDSTVSNLETCSNGSISSLGDHVIVDMDNDGYMDIVGSTSDTSTTVYWGTIGNCFNITSSWTITGSNATWTSGRVIATPRGYGWIVIDDSPARMGIVEVDRANATLIYQYLEAIGVNSVQVVDVNNDGLDDFINENGLWLQNGSDPANFTYVSKPFSGTPPGGQESVFTDYTSDGMADFLGLGHAYDNTGNNRFGYDFALLYSDSTGTPTYNSGGVYGYRPVNRTSYSLADFSSDGFFGYMVGSQYRHTQDLNGDGLLDLVWHRKPPGSSTGYWYAKLNTGDGFTTTIDDGISSGANTNQYSFTLDWNKDGRQDLIASNTAHTGWRVLLATYNGGGFEFKPVSTDPLPSGVTAIAGVTIITPHLQLLRGDFNNDGLIDVACTSCNEHGVWYAKQQQPDLLAKVTDGFGAEIKLEYSPLDNKIDNNGEPLYTQSSNVVFPQRHALRNMQVVKKFSVSNGLTGGQAGYRDRYFHYTGAKYDVQGRGFLGFERILVTDTSTGVVTKTDYRQDYPFIGRIASVEIKDGDDQLIGVKDNHYAIHGANARFPYMDYSIERQYSLTTASVSEPLAVTKTVNTFDQYGGLTAQTVTIGTGLSGTTVTGVKRVATADNTLTNNTTDWLLGFVEESIVETSTDGSTGLRTVETEFDPEYGTLDVAVRRDFVGTSVWKTTTTTRNGNGVVTEIESEAGDLGAVTTAARTTTLSGFSDLIYPGTRTNGLDHETGFTYDKRFGLVASETDPNDLTTSWEYDALGRQISKTDADDTVTRIIRHECAGAPVTCPSAAVYLVATEVTNHNAAGKLGAPLKIAYYDKLQRVVRKESYSLNGAVIKVDQEYYADGRVHRVSEPFTGSTPAAWTIYADYDALNRPLEAATPDGGSAEYAYTRENGLSKTVTTVNVVTPGGSDTQVKTRYMDALGQIIRVLDANSTPVDYAYDTQGNLATTQVNSNSGTTITIVHDVAGNKTSITDPDAGKIDFEYNGFGELRRQTWDGAADKSMEFSYDVLGRKTGRTDDPVTGSNISYTWTWDTVKQGLLTSQSGNGITENYAYDGLSRTQSITTVISGLSGSRVFEYTYDAFSRPSTIEYPDGLVVEHQYHAAGIQVQTRDVSNASDPRLLWTIGEDSDTRGNLYQQRFGNGVITLSTFDEESGHIAAIKTGWATASGLTGLVGNIQDLSYEFDTLGNLYKRTTARTDLAGDPLEYTEETFAYDDLNRLTSTYTNWAGIGTRSRSYGYDALGNLTSRTGVSDMTYGQSANNGGVHALTYANGRDYVYDDYGNLIERGSETLEYNVFNKPTRIGSTYFTYGPDHARFKQVDGSRTTYYINGSQYEEIVDGSDITQRSYVGGYLLRSTVSSTTTLTYLHKDHIGSVEAMTDASGNMIPAGRMSFDPWGQRQEVDWDTATSNPTGGDPDFYPTTRGFTGHEMLDGLDLIHMNGRVYDPVIGRFLSADLYIQAPFNSQSFNRYSYVFNNPLSYTDPSGYDPCRSDCEEVVVYGQRNQTTSPEAIAAMQAAAMNAYGAYAAASERARDMAMSYGPVAYVVTVTIDEIFIADAMASIKAAGEGDLTGVVWSAGQALAKPLKAIDKVVDSAESLEKKAEKAEKALDVGSNAKKGPAPNGGDAKKHGGDAHDSAINKRVDELKQDSSVTDIRKNQVQVDVNGNRVGDNRPDLQYNKDGCHYCVEYDNSLDNSVRHGEVIRANDPNARVELNRL
jgi:RHS repeat-associated protein